jgi:hypothetical protein
MQAMAEQTELTALIAQNPGRCGLYRELCRIAADVYTRDGERPVVVDGETATFGYLQEIFGLITAENMEDVADRLAAYPREIRHKKAFMRTMLYNSVFELETATENRYAQRYAEQ